MNSFLLILLGALVIQGALCALLRRGSGSFPVLPTLMRSFNVLTRNWVGFGALLLLAFAPRILLAIAGPPEPVSPRGYFAASNEFWYWTFATVFSTAAAAVLPAMYAFGTLRTLDGSVPFAGITIRKGIQAGLRIIPLAILMCALGAATGLAAMGLSSAWLETAVHPSIGMLVLAVVPLGLATTTAALFYLCIPVAILEGRGPLASITRSVELTHGHYRSLVLLQTISFIGTGLLLLVIHAALGAPDFFMDGVPASWSLSWRGAVVVGLLHQPVCMTIVYQLLRRTHDGTDVDALLGVFE